MNIVFSLDGAIIAATVAEWVIRDGIGVISLTHSEVEEIIIEPNKITVDGQDAKILEMTPDIRKYL
jgi:hypothetical protein